MRCPSGIQPPNRARTRGWPALCLSSLDCPAVYILADQKLPGRLPGQGRPGDGHRPAAPAQLGDPRGGEAVGDRAEGRRRRRLAQGGSRPGRTQRPAGERRPHLGCPVPGLWRRISASSATAWLPSRGLNRPGFTGTVLCPWFRGAAWLDSHATVKAFSNSIGVSMPRLLWRRCRL
jgi:hypothetical protein